MYRDMTRGSITRGLLLFALPMAAGDPCGAGLCAGGAGGRQRHLGRYPYRLVSGGRRGIRLLLPPAQSAAPRGERRLIRGIKKSGASSMNCTPFVGQYGIDKQKLIDVLDARATRSKSLNADIIALHNGSVLFARRYKK